MCRSVRDQLGNEGTMTDTSDRVGCGRGWAVFELRLQVILTTTIEGDVKERWGSLSIYIKEKTRYMHIHYAAVSWSPVSV